MKRTRRTVFQIFFSLVVGLLLAGAAFAGLSPQFGGTPTKAEKARFARTGRYVDGEFQNLIPTELMTGSNMASVMWEFLFKKTPGKNPPGPLPMRLLDSLSITRKTPELLRVTWFGHSASLLEIGGRTILLDPMLSQDMGPVSWLTPNRYNPRVPIRTEQLPPIDAVLISHDHYDHLDYETIGKLKGKTGLFLVPLGVAAHLRAWGVDTARIRELDWHDSVQVAGLTIISTPARHFSGRGPHQPQLHFLDLLGGESARPPRVLQRRRGLRPALRRHRPPARPLRSGPDGMRPVRPSLGRYPHAA